MKSFHMLRDSNLHHLLITGKITYSNTMQEPPSAKTLSWLDASGTVKGPSSCGMQTALLVHRLVYEIEPHCCFHLILPSPPMLIWVPNLMRARPFQRESTLMRLWHSYVAGASWVVSRGSQKFTEVWASDWRFNCSALPSPCNKGGSQPSSG